MPNNDTDGDNHSLAGDPTGYYMHGSICGCASIWAPQWTTHTCVRACDELFGIFSLRCTRQTRMSVTSQLGLASQRRALFTACRVLGALSVTASLLTRYVELSMCQTVIQSRAVFIRLHSRQNLLSEHWLIACNGCCHCQQPFGNCLLALIASLEDFNASLFTFWSPF